jgi:cell division transport system permease protein
MTRTLHVLRELFRNIFRNPGTSFSAILSISLLLLLFDLFWIAAGTSDRFYEDLLSGVNMEVYLNEDVTDTTRTALEDEIKSVPGVASVAYISKEEARQDLTNLVGVDLLVGYDTLNPLPRSFVLKFVPEYLNTKALNSISQRLQTFAGVSQVSFSRKWLEKAESTKGIIRNVGLMLGLLILITVLVSSANNMRLTARTRTAGFYQMRLLGAGTWFLVGPFLLEGLIMGGISAGLGWLLIYYWKDKVDFTQITIVFPNLEQIFIYCGLAALLGLVSGFLGIRKLLRT